MDLPEGHHEYKFLVDGEWKYNENEAACDNNIGSLNNVISIKESDFEEFENALLRDPNDKNDKTYGVQALNKEKGEGKCHIDLYNMVIIDFDYRKM